MNFRRGWVCVFLSMMLERSFRLGLGTLAASAT